MGRADGIHWRTGAAPNGREGAADPILDVLQLDAPTILNEPEAQWHYAPVVARRAEYAASAGYTAGPTIWRSSPERKPTQARYDPFSFSRSVFIGLDAHRSRTGMYPTDVLLLNEQNLNYERGDEFDDTDASQWPSNYAAWARFHAELLQNCKDRAADRSWSPRWWYQAWAPGHGEMREDIAALWVPAAQLYDGVCLHAYDSVDVVTQTVEWYARTFPGHPLLLGEWNAPNDGVQELAIRERLQALCRQISRLSACYFIWRWAEDDNRRYDIEGNSRRLVLWDGTAIVRDDGYVAPGDIADAPEQPQEGSEEPIDPPVPSETPTDDPGPVDAPTGDPPEETMPDDRLYTYGVDVSNWQELPDWVAVAASGRQFAAMKATEGTRFADPTFGYNWKRTAEVGLVRIAYHFARPSANGPEAEADYFLSNVFGLGGFTPGDCIWLDLEDDRVGNGADLSDWTYRWLRYVEGIVGFKPIVYTGNPYATSHRLGRQPALAEYGVCIAAYPAPASTDWPDLSRVPGVPEPWASAGAPLAFWQYSSSGRVPGIDGDCDLDVFFGSVEQLRRYGSPSIAEPPAPDPQPEPSPVGFNVGPGILAEMNRRGDEPITSEVFQKDPAGTDQFSEAVGRSGSAYRYVPSTGRVYVTHTDATAEGTS